MADSQLPSTEKLPQRVSTIFPPFMFNYADLACGYGA
jgi:hypothetical protein